MDAGATAAPASGALARGALLLLFGLLRRAAAPHTDGLGDGLAVMVHVADLNRVARLEIGGADVLAALLDLGLRVDREGPLGVLALLLAGHDHAVGGGRLHGAARALGRHLLLADLLVGRLVDLLHVCKSSRHGCW